PFFRPDIPVCVSGLIGIWFPEPDRSVCPACTSIDTKTARNLAVQRHRVMVALTKPQRIFHDCCATSIFPSTTTISSVFLAQEHAWGLRFDCLSRRIKVVGQIIDHVTITITVFRGSPRSMFPSSLP